MIRPVRPTDAARNLEIWRAAVHATHDFLLPAHLREIDDLVSRHLAAMVDWVAADEEDRPLGFMATSGAHIDALFIDPAVHGRGLGRAFVEFMAARHPAITVDVNEQNGRAVGFYEQLGFRRVGRSPTDDQGRPYPLLHLRRDSV